MKLDTRVLGMFSYTYVRPGPCSPCGTLGEEAGGDEETGM